ncbi:MAG: hypothetical protein HC853_07310 [Anaerolineae bacterium]|nr:hypothetical protein [Anaerolineae bacterium]
MADVLGNLNRNAEATDSDKPPTWMVRLANRLKPEGNFATHLAQTQAKEQAEAARDEKVRR